MCTCVCVCGGGGGGGGGGGVILGSRILPGSILAICNKIFFCSE